MSLRLIRDDLVKKLPAQAMKCTLNDWELLPCSEEIQNQFELLTLEKRLHLRVVDVTLDGIVVDLYEPEQNKNISQMLNLIENEEKIIRKSLNYQNVENQHSTKMASKIDQRYLFFFLFIIIQLGLSNKNLCILYIYFKYIKK